MKNKLNKKHTLFLNEFKILFIILFLLFLTSVFGQISAMNGAFISTTVQKHLIRSCVGIFLMLSVYRCNFRLWSSCAYLFYGITFLALVVVEVIGIVKLGAQRWIDLYFFTFQPSEVMKLTLILALSKYYSTLSPFEIKDLKKHILPTMLTILPVVLVLKQPDLGTAGILLCSGITIIFLSGFPQRTFIGIALAGVALCPLQWFALHTYQKNRIITFLNPDLDPLGTGYHVLQSKISIGSGGLFGKGFLKGTQSKLNFLPEKNTDFIFTTIAEEVGFIGASIIIVLLLCLTIFFFVVGYSAKTVFSRLLCLGLGMLLFLHIFINIAMVMGVVPIVGIPLPFLSYGGSSMVTFAISCGLVMSALANKKM